MAKENNNHREFLLTYFKQEAGYEELQVNGWWLVKHWDGNKQRVTVDVYSPESFKNYQRGRAKFRELEQQQNHLLSI